ncbi:MAG: hypothetical protein AAB152_12260 [Candidatus Coatesbacteria bacterium]
MTAQGAASPPEIRFDLWPTGAYTKKDAEGVAKLLNRFGKTVGSTSSGLRGIDLQTGLQFATLLILSGFLEGIGDDAYRWAKKKLLAFFAAPVARAKLSGRYKKGDGGSIWISCTEGKVKLGGVCFWRDPRSIEIFLDKMKRAVRKLQRDICKKKIGSGPERVEIWYSYVDRKGVYLGWQNTNGKLKTEVRVISKEEERLMKASAVSSPLRGKVGKSV